MIFTRKLVCCSFPPKRKYLFCFEMKIRIVDFFLPDPVIVTGLDPVWQENKLSNREKHGINSVLYTDCTVHI
jgi:hypothetical protein